MADPRFRLLAEITNAEGTSTATAAISPDWFPAEESLRFLGLRRNRNIPAGTQARIEPIWGAEGPPFVRGVRLSLADEQIDLPITYFRSQVRAVAADALGDENLGTGRLTYRITAFPLDGDAYSAQPAWGVLEVDQSPFSGERPLSQYLDCAVPQGNQVAAAGEDFPIFIPLSILRQAEELMASAEDKETGGVLIGHLWKDCDSSEVFAEITGLVPAKHTLAKSTSLTFVPETWEAVRSAIRLRGRGEVFMAWHHTHPTRFWSHCEEEAQKNCPLGKQFFSADDLAVQRTIFSKAYHFALVTGDRPRAEGGWEMIHSLYGWRNGEIESRGFYVFDGAAAELAPKPGAVAFAGSARGAP